MFLYKKRISESENKLKKGPRALLPGTSSSWFQTGHHCVKGGRSDGPRHVPTGKRRDLFQSHSPSSSSSHYDSDRQACEGQSNPLQRKRTTHSENDIFRIVSERRRSTITVDNDADQEDASGEIERLMSRIFGKKRQEQTEGAPTRHSGVVFRNLTVKGVGLGAALHPTIGDIFLALPRKMTSLIRGANLGKPPERELISNFNGCVRPGELLLVLGRPGAGCSTFLKAFCNQRAGFSAVQGDVTYGGLGAEEMAKQFRGELIYNPEDDLHYATLSVRATLSFALETRTPGKESRLKGERRADYVKEFLRVVSKLFWIEHTLETKVGNEFIHGVSGGERKRVSIAEAIVTRASVQGWDNSSRGLDASTASNTCDQSEP